MRLDINAMEDERQGEPFEVGTSTGVTVTFRDANDLHWTELADLDSSPARKQVAMLVPDPNQFKAFVDDPKIDGHKLQKVLDAYRRHFGLGSPGE